MSGKKGRSGKTRSHHGGWVFMRQGIIKDDRRFIEIALNRMKQELVDCLGGDERVEAGQLIIIDQIVQYSGYQMLVSYHLKSIGPTYLDDEGRLHVQPALQNFFLTAGSQIARNIEKLGLTEAQVKEKMDLQAYLIEAGREVELKLNGASVKARCKGRLTVRVAELTARYLA
ncbi:hypothetical protein ES702_07439 [subsurface metagenome]